MIEKYEQKYKNISDFQLRFFNKFIKNCKTIETTLDNCIVKANTGADAIQKAPIVSYKTNCKCVRVGDFTNNRNLNEWAYCKITDKNFKNYHLLKDDILITRTASIGLVKFIFKDISAVYNNGIIRIKANEKVIKPILLYLICISEKFVNYINENVSGSSTRPNMKIDYVLKYKLSIPTITEQNNIENKLLLLEQLKYNIESKIDKLKQTKELLLKKYFG